MLTLTTLYETPEKRPLQPYNLFILSIDSKIGISLESVCILVFTVSSGVNKAANIAPLVLPAIKFNFNI